MSKYARFALALAVGAGLAMSTSGSAFAAAHGKMATPKKGGTLNFVVGSKIPSYDGHIEGTFGMIHPIRPFYSLLIRENPQNPASATDFVCDLCVGDVPKGENGGTVFKFKIRKDVKFHDGTPLTSADVKATLDKVVFPPKGIPSARKAFFKAVKSIEAPDAETLIITLKFPTGSFIPALAMPFNFVYSKKDLDEKGYTWHKTNVNGSGAFKFKEHVKGSHVSGVRYDGYHHKGKPYLDGYKAISAPKLAVRVQAIRGDRAAIEFRGFPPAQRDELVKALGKDITVQESDWNCVLLATPNQQRKDFQDPRVRQALSLAIDRWGGSQHLSRIAIVKTVGGVVFPNHPLAATKAELLQLNGYGLDLKANRAKAKELLKAAGKSGMSFEFNNRGVDQPYKVVGTWLIGQWRQVGLNVKQRVQPSPPFYATLRKKKDFDVSIDFNCQSIINPIADISKFLGSAGNNYGNYKDQELEDLYNTLLQTGSEAKQREIIRVYEKRALSDQAHEMITLWWYKINPHRSYVKGWKIAPSHYLNQHLDQVWIDK
ncbi:MAG: ABC transporter substrate-binding protein [Rhodospirillaceae bacterium]